MNAVIVGICSYNCSFCPPSLSSLFALPHFVMGWYSKKAFNRCQCLDLGLRSLQSCESMNFCSLNFSVYSILLQQHKKRTRAFYLHKWNFIPFSHHFPYPCNPLFYSASRRLVSLESTYKWGLYSVCLSVPSLFHLACPLCSSILSQMYFLPFKVWMIFVCVRKIFFIHSSFHGPLGWFHSLTVINNTAINREMQISP